MSSASSPSGGRKEEKEAIERLAKQAQWLKLFLEYQVIKSAKKPSKLSGPVERPSIGNPKIGISD
jgi:hypothetical protein